MLWNSHSTPKERITEIMDLREDEIGGYFEWTDVKIKQYYLEDLLLHWVGHSIYSFNERYRSRIFTPEAELLIFELP